MAVILSFVVIVGGAAWLGLHKRQQWRTFAEQHNCQKVGKIEDDLVTSVGFDAKGMPVLSTGISGGKTAWKCSDGVTYWR